jgi:hypothetical protein
MLNNRIRTGTSFCETGAARSRVRGNATASQLTIHAWGKNRCLCELLLRPNP